MCCLQINDIPLCEFQVWCVVNHGRRFPIQPLPFQTETVGEETHDTDYKCPSTVNSLTPEIKPFKGPPHLKSMAPRPISIPVRTVASSLKTMAPSA